MVVYCVQSNETHLGGDHRCQQCGKQRRNDDLTRHHTAKALDQKYLYTENYGFFFYIYYIERAIKHYAKLKYFNR